MLKPSKSDEVHPEVQHMVDLHRRMSLLGADVDRSRHDNTQHLEDIKEIVLTIQEWQRKQTWWAVGTVLAFGVGLSPAWAREVEIAFGGTVLGTGLLIWILIAAVDFIKDAVQHRKERRAAEPGKAGQP